MSDIYTFKLIPSIDMYDVTQLAFLLINSQLLPEKEKSYGKLVRQLDENNNTLVVGIYDKNLLIGTVSLSLYSGKKLTTDHYFSNELSEFRDNNLQLRTASVWRLLVHPNYIGGRIGKLLIKKIIVISKTFEIDKCFSVINSNHYNYYNKKLFANKISEKCIEDLSLILIELDVNKIYKEVINK